MAVWRGRYPSICLNADTVRIAGSPAQSSFGYSKDERSDSGKCIIFEGDQLLSRGISFYPCQPDPKMGLDWKKEKAGVVTRIVRIFLVPY